MTAPVPPTTHFYSNFRKKFLLPLAYCGIVALAIWSGDSMISHFKTDSSYAVIAPAAGESAEAVPEGAMTAAGPVIAPVDASVLTDAPTVLELPQTDAPEEAPLRISFDKPEIVTLKGDAVNVIVGSEETLRAVPDTNSTIILIPKKPGATYFKAIDANGRVLMQRHVIVGASKPQYLRIRRSCANGEEGCKQYSVYYCPDMCHEVNVIQDEKAAAASEAPKDVASGTPPADAQNGNVNEPVTDPATPENTAQ
ncbi:MAG: pilus assembly protein N-terminal domain-containing protein [Pseudobdellovibrionaceae bacterium]